MYSGIKLIKVIGTCTDYVNVEFNQSF